jgi:outer membrane receptor protein involved in Fe transport
MKKLRRALSMSLLLMAILAGTSAPALALGRVRFVVVDPVSHSPIPNAAVVVRDLSCTREPMVLFTGGRRAVATSTFDVEKWSASLSEGKIETVLVPLGDGVTIQVQGDQVPTKEIYIKVTATRLRVRAANTGPGTTRTQEQIKKFTNVNSGNSQSLVQSQSGVASDSAGQAHVRGEHSEITYVVDGVPLPDTLSGRQGAIVVPSTVASLDMLTGGFAPEFGIQTAAILNITTTPGARKLGADIALQGGSYNTLSGDFTAVGPLGKLGSFTFNANGNRTSNFVEPQQPDNQTAHNSGSSYSVFSKLRFDATRKDVLTATVSHNPNVYQNSNRSGLPADFTDVGQGFGFQGLRNANGKRPDVTADNTGALGSQEIPLPSQEAAGQDINTREMNEFATLSWRHQIDQRDSALLALTLLHSGQDVTNNNPAVDQLNLLIDNSIEYNPNVSRNVHHVQLTGSVTSQRGPHQIKGGFVYDQQSGKESYQIGSASQLALDELAALDPTLAPAGAIQVDKAGNPILDVNGNPVYKASSNAVPTLHVSRSGSYKAAYIQDTWKVSRRFTVNYGLRADWFNQTQNLGQDQVNVFLLSPRLNFSYGLDKRTALRWSYNKLFNTPPLAQGAIVGAPIQPETLDQYDVSLEHEIAPGQSFKAAYYVKQMHNQVDTGLLIPGSQIGLFSAVNFERGGVHGLELSYDLYSTKGSGWDGFINYSFSKAAPNGFDSAGAPAPDFNDHDQRNTLGLGLAYTWKNDATLAATFNYGSGLASSIIRDNRRTPRSQLDLRYSSSPKLFHGHGGFGIDIENVFDSRTVINFQSGFSGTRFMQGRRILFSLFGKF